MDGCVNMAKIHWKEKEKNKKQDKTVIEQLDDLRTEVRMLKEQVKQLLDAKKPTV
jgi:hypothetical protein